MKKGMNKLNKTPRWYLYLVIIYALIGIFDSIILFNGIKFFLTYFTVLGVIWVLFNAGLLFYFKNGFENRAYILPTYYVGFFFLAYVLISFVNSINVAIGTQLVSSCIELAIALYLIKN